MGTTGFPIYGPKTQRLRRDFDAMASRGEVPSVLQLAVGLQTAVAEIDRLEGFDANHCPECGEPRPHFINGMCEQCWNETKNKNTEAETPGPYSAG